MHLDIADALHDLDFRLPHYATGALVPVAQSAHKERCAAGVAIGGLDDEVVSQPCAVRERRQFVVGAHPPDHVRHAGYARLVGQARHDDLGFQAMTQLRRGVHDLEPRLARKRLGLFVQHHKTGLATGTPVLDELECLGITQQVVAHIPHAVEIPAVAPPGHEHARMFALERVVVGQVEEVSDPAIDAQQVERRRRDEVQRHGVVVKERAYVRKAVQHAARLGLRLAGGHDHASRGDVDAGARRRDGGAGGGVAVSATAVSSHGCMAKVCTRPWPRARRGLTPTRPSRSHRQPDMCFTCPICLQHVRHGSDPQRSRRASPRAEGPRSGATDEPERFPPSTACRDRGRTGPRRRSRPSSGTAAPGSRRERSRAC